MAFQPRRCARVGSAKEAANQSRTGGENAFRATVQPYPEARTGVGPTVGCAHVAGRTRHLRPPLRGRARVGRRPDGRAGRARARADDEPATLRQPRRLAGRARRRCAGAGRDLGDRDGAQGDRGGGGRGLPRARQHPRVRERRRGRARRADQRRGRLHHRQRGRPERAHPHHGRLVDRRRRPRRREGRRGGGREGGGPDPAERGLHPAGAARGARHPRGRRGDRGLRPAARAPVAAVGAPRRGPGRHRRPHGAARLVRLGVAARDRSAPRVRGR